jgi:putative nucleotidyltransferase with HDIG domain
MDKMTTIITQITDILQTEVFLVGGSVRDCILGNIPSDYDFCTALLPDEVEKRIKEAGRHCYSVGKRFGTLGMRLPIGDGNYQYVEITTFRGEQYDNKNENSLSNNRKPTVNFITNLKEDLSRRDFTINSLAMDITGKIIDYYGGQEDLENKIIRMVGKPKQRFKEDPLRILRAIRFAAKYNFQIESETWEYISKMKFELLRVSKERWVQELDKILVLSIVKAGLYLLMDSGVLGVIIPELSLQKGYDQNSPWHDYTLWEHTCNVLDNVPSSNLNLRWSALLHDIAKPFTRTENPKGHSNYINHDVLGAEMSKKVSKYLNFSNDRSKYIFDTVLNHLSAECELKVYDDDGKKRLQGW